MTQSFAAFVSFNSKDRDDAQVLAGALGERGVRVWMSDLDLIPGALFTSEIENVLQSVPAAIILIGRSGIGEWQKTEVVACINEAAQGKIRVIPVLLPGGPDHAGIGPFLASRLVVDLRGGVNDEAKLRELVRGIRGLPDLRDALETTRILVAETVGDGDDPRPRERRDAWAMAAVKSRLHAASEVYAQMAADNAAMASSVYPEDMLTIFIPLVVDLRWNRGYASGLERLLQIPPATKRLSDLDVEEASPACPVHEGVLSAERLGEESRVLIRLAGEPAVVVSGLDDTAADAVLEAINGYGCPSRFGCQRNGGRLTSLELA